jgi:hypothetical protein
MCILLATALVAVLGGLGQRADAQCETKIMPSDGAADDRFGDACSIDGDVMVVGAPWHDDLGIDSGAAYVYRRDGDGWTEEAKLLASDGAAGDEFGWAVSISGNRIVVGAGADDDQGDDSGSAYVFSYAHGAWTEEAKLLASDGAAGDEFGHAVAVHGDTVCVGAWGDDDNGPWSGSAYVFHLGVFGWNEDAKLLASDGEDYDYYGVSVSLDADALVVGAIYDDDNGDNSGSAYVYRHDGPAWTQEAKLLPSDGEAHDNFGVFVSIDGVAIGVGAWGDDDNGGSSGSAYVFRHDGLAWNEDAKLLASDGSYGDVFGICVSINGDAMVVGAPLDDDNGSSSGSAYVFRYDGAQWTEDDKLLASEDAAHSAFGDSVSLDGDMVVVGALWGNSDSGVDNVGSAYAIDLVCDCPADFNGDTVVNSLDFIAFLNAFVATDPAADYNNDGIVNSLDFIAFLNDFVAGC